MFAIFIWFNRSKSKSSCSVMIAWYDVISLLVSPGMLCKRSNDHSGRLFQWITRIYLQLLCKFTTALLLSTLWPFTQMVHDFWSYMYSVCCTQEDVTPKRVVEIVEMLRRGEKPPVSKIEPQNWHFIFQYCISVLGLMVLLSFTSFFSHAILHFSMARKTQSG